MGRPPRNVSTREIRKVSDVLRTAAILHDVGKVAVSDVILKKPGELTYDEKLKMRQHTVLGARLFQRTNSFWDYMAAEVALNHHENWDGTGYPGKIDDLFAAEDLHGAGEEGHGDPAVGAGRRDRRRVRRARLRSAPTRRAGARSTPCATSATRRERSSIPSWWASS